MDYKLYLMTGEDIPIQELSLVAHSPTVREIAMMGKRNFFMAMQYLCLEKQQLIQDETLLTSMNNFQVLMKVLEQSKDREKKTAINTLLMLMFPRYNVVMMPRSINFITTGEDKQTFMVDESNFDDLQAAVKEILCAKSMLQGDNVVYNPKGKKAKEIADKLMRGRMRVAAQKSTGGGECVLTRYISILAGAKIASIDESKNYNLFQLFDLMERYTAYIEWDTDLRIRLAGGKTDKQVESWMRDLYKEVSTSFSAKDIPSGMQVYNS